MYRPIKFATEKIFDIINDKSHAYKSSSQKDNHLAFLLAKTNLAKFYYKSKIYVEHTRLFSVINLVTSIYKKFQHYYSIMNDFNLFVIISYLFLLLFFVSFFLTLICFISFHYLDVVYFERTLSGIPIIKPDHILKVVWDFLILFFYLFLIFSYPIQISFNFTRFWIVEYFENYYLENFNFEILFAIIYGLNILIKLNVAYYDKGLLVTEKMKIVRNYFKNEFFYDMIGYIPVFMQVYYIFNPHLSFIRDTIGYAEILFFIKIKEIKKTTRFLEETLNLNDKDFACLQLFKLVLTLLLFSNVMGCIWHAVSLKFSPIKNMLKSQNYIDRDWQSRYSN